MKADTKLCYSSFSMVILPFFPLGEGHLTGACAWRKTAETGHVSLMEQLTGTIVVCGKVSALMMLK
jgi:hypothetical protein